MAKMRFMFTFKLNYVEIENKKFKLIYCRDETKLLLEDFVPYIHEDNETIEFDVVILEKKAKISLILFYPQIRTGVCIVKSYYITLVEPPESRFTASLGLFDINHVCRRTCAVILIDKDFGFSLEPYCLDILSLLVFAPKVIDNVICCYYHLSLETSRHITSSIY